MKKLAICLTLSLLAQSSFGYDIEKAEYERKTSKDVVYTSLTGREYRKGQNVSYSVFSNQVPEACESTRHVIHKQFSINGYIVLEANCSNDGSMIEIVFIENNREPKEKKSDW